MDRASIIVRHMGCVFLFLVTTALALPLRAADADVDRALAAGRIRAEAGAIVAPFSPGAVQYYGGEDTAQAIAWIRRAADQQFAPAEFQMGQVYDFGFGVPQDDPQALAWYRRAADHGSAPAQRALGDFYRKGRAVT